MRFFSSILFYNFQNMVSLNTKSNTLKNLTHLLHFICVWIYKCSFWIYFIVKTTLKIKKMFVWLCISMMKEKLNGWITQWCTLIKFHFYLIKTPQQIYLLFQNKLELWVGFFFTDTHTKLPSTVIRQIMLSFCINHPINQALIY